MFFAAGNQTDTRMFVVGIDFETVQFHRVFLQGSGSGGANGVVNAGDGGKQKLSVHVSLCLFINGIRFEPSQSLSHENLLRMKNVFHLLGWRIAQQCQ